MRTRIRITFESYIYEQCKISIYIGLHAYKYKFKRPTSTFPYLPAPHTLIFTTHSLLLLLLCTIFTWEHDQMQDYMVTLVCTRKQLSRFGLYKITSFVVFRQGALPACSKCYLSVPMLHKSSEECQDRPTY